MSSSQIDVPRSYNIVSNLSSLAEGLLQVQPRPHQLPSGDLTVTPLATLVTQLIELEEVMARGAHGAVREMEDHLRATLDAAIWHDR